MTLVSWHPQGVSSALSPGRDRTFWSPQPLIRHAQVPPQGLRHQLCGQLPACFRYPWCPQRGTADKLALPPTNLWRLWHGQKTDQLGLNWPDLSGDTFARGGRACGNLGLVGEADPGTRGGVHVTPGLTAQQFARPSTGASSP